MRNASLFAITTIWMLFYSICSGYSGGSGTTQNPYQISNLTDLLDLAKTTSDYDKSFILTADIDMQTHLFSTAVIAPDTDPVEYNFQGTSFGGTLDGNGYKIMNLTIETESEDYLGLFGYIRNGTVKNLKLENFSISYSSESFFVGGLAGAISICNISGCQISGSITGSDFAESIGGLTGFTYNSTVNMCHSNVDISGLMNISSVGGLVGSNGYGGLISDCHATGSIAGDYAAGGLCGSNIGVIRDCQTDTTVWGMENALYIGGLCGLNSDTIENCFAVGSVDSGSGSYFVGGLCGGNLSSQFMLNCYASGAVTAGEYSSNIGGLCGDNYYGVIQNCYSTGTVLADSNSVNLGGLCGFQSTEYSAITDSFWDTESSNMSVGFILDPDSPGTITNVLGLTTEQMKTRSTFTDSGWDFTDETANGTQDIWKMCEDGSDYPRLVWQLAAAGDFVCPAGTGSEDLEILAGCWLQIVRSSADITQDDSVNLADFVWLTQYWLMSDCGLCDGADITGDSNVDSSDLIGMAEDWLVQINRSCRMADINADDIVDLNDLAIFALHWLEGPESGGGEE